MDPERLWTLAQNIHYVRERVSDHKAKPISAKALKQVHPINEVSTGSPKPVEGDAPAEDSSLNGAVKELIMYMKKGTGKGKGKGWGEGKGKGDKGVGKGNDGKGNGG